MHSAVSTFAGQLRHFARSVDIVDDATFDQFRRLIYRYVKNELDAAYFELLREQAMDHDAALKMFWSSEDRDHNWPVRRADGTYSNVIALAFGEQRPLWIVGQDHEPLDRAAGLEDQWFHNADLPGYEPSADKAIRTLIVLPLRRRRILGVCYFECSSYLGITDVATTELQLLGDAIAILLELYEANRTQSSLTSSAITELQERLEKAKFPRLTRPHFFVAFSKRADEQVVNVIKEVLHGLADRLEFTDWSLIDEAGNINTQIAREITRSRFGICYLSEPAKNSMDPAVAYGDNPNVVFEAGMLHGKSVANDTDDGGEPTGWIPVREASSPPAPFDFATERILVVPRAPDDNSLNEYRLSQSLNSAILKLLHEE
jgi:hypothetical protein